MIKETYKIFFGTLNNPNRLSIINLLRKGDKNVTEITKKLQLNQTTVSHNLRRLEKCGFVKSKQKGKQRYYSLNNKTIKPLMLLIDKHMSKHCVHLLNKGDI